ncbi:MAG TPA: histidine kinase [Saprospiraceae bacterium]|nr:histidine kinase [Saprospiraceae bacterium]
MQKEYKYITKLVTTGIIVGIGVSVIIMILKVLMGGNLTWDHKMIIEFSYSVYFGFVLTIINSAFFDYLNHKVNWTSQTEKYRMAIGFIGSIPLTMMGAWFVRLTIDVWINNQSFAAFIKDQKFSNYIFILIITFVVSLFFHAIFLYKKLQENRVKEQKIIAGNASAQFETLKNQIDPHFLFNSLNVLSSLIEENPENAQRFTTSLSKIYRYVLEQKDKELVPLQEELNFAKTYMKLLSMRFENSLTYSLPNTLIDDDAKVVPLSLQLLLENTIKHNIVSDIHPLHITITVDGDYLSVSNNLQKKEVLQSGSGVGLKNIVNRYAILTEKPVLVESNEDYFVIKIPLLTKEINLIKNKSYNEMDAYYKAKKQVKDIKDFYGNLISYCFVIPLLAWINYQTSWEFKWFVFPMLGWGLGVALQAFTVFGYGKTWEERKISELMEKHQNINQRKWE